MAAGAGFAPARPPSKGGVLLVRRPGNGLVEPEVVATSPNRIKSPVPVCCGFDSLEMVLTAGLAPALATLSTSCLCVGLREQNEWSLPPVLPRPDCLTKEIRRLLPRGEVVAVPGAAPDAAGL